MRSTARSRPAIYSRAPPLNPCRRSRACRPPRIGRSAVPWRPSWKDASGLRRQAPGKVLDPFEFRRAELRVVQAVVTDGRDLGAGRPVQDAERVELMVARGGKAQHDLKLTALFAGDEVGVLRSPCAEGVELVQRFEKGTHLSRGRFAVLDLRLPRDGRPAGPALDAV